MCLHQNTQRCAFISQILNGKLHITETHPIWANGSWIAAGKLKVGDFLQDQFGNKVELRTIEIYHKHVEIYNLYVSSDEHTFFAEGFLVHNKNLRELSSNELTEHSIKSEILQNKYSSLEDFVGELQTKVIAQHDKILFLEEQIDSMKSKFAEAANSFKDISKAFQTISSSPPIDDSVFFLHQDTFSPIAKPEREGQKVFARIQMDEQLKNFDEERQCSLINTIADQVHIPKEEIELVYVISGSVTVTLQMPREAALKFMSFYLNHSPIIDELKIERVELRPIPFSLETPPEFLALPIQSEEKTNTRILFLTANPSDTARLRMGAVGLGRRSYRKC
ncbi:MAG: hypothetical protein GY801_39945 [bacterium]|nr:hypothetical protein [bacterium]